MIVIVEELFKTLEILDIGEFESEKLKEFTQFFKRYFFPKSD